MSEEYSAYSSGLDDASAEVHDVIRKLSLEAAVEGGAAPLSPNGAAAPETTSSREESPSQGLVQAEPPPPGAFRCCL